MLAKTGTALRMLTLVVLAGCNVTIDLGSDSLFPTGTSFVLSGTADIVDTSDGPCLVWQGENGVTYHLFQTAAIENADFDAVTTPGTTARLEIATRTDLVVSCQIGTVVEVKDILEIVP